MPNSATKMVNTLPQQTLNHKDMANAIRALSMDAVEKAQSGHPGMPMGMADIATVLYSQFLKFDAANPEWPDRDRFILSNGHGSMLLYSLAYLTGYKAMTMDEIKNFRQLGSHTAGHPEHNVALGIETTTGPLGQGLGNAVGMALAERIMNARFGDDLVNHRTYVFCGDGCLSEGISQEAISFAGHLGLSKLTVLFDDNAITIDGSTELSISDDQCKRFEASGWHTQRIDGHDPAAIAKAIETAHKSDKPSFIACKTTIGYGAPHKAGTAASHGSPLGAEEITETRKALGWEYAPFEIPEKVLSQWRQVGSQGQSQYQQWQQRFQQSPEQEEFQRQLSGVLPANFEQALQDLKKQGGPDRRATRQLSQSVLECIAPVTPELVGGSADLTGSNNTKASSMKAISPGHYDGSYIYYGVREHGMAAIMNGMALHGGIIPYGGSFLTFTDYCRPAIRLSALMKQRVIYVMTHDSIGLGEDGPTHQPIEHLASLRAIPHLQVFRPADAIETLECWQAALESATPSVISLTRQNVPTVRHDYTAQNLCAKGAYILKEASTARKVTLIATGSEVGLALDVAKALDDQGTPTAVVSMPCWELFEQQYEAYKNQILGPESALRVSIEAASTFGWERYVGRHGLTIGIQDFGASAPAADLFKHFGFTVEAIVNKIKAKL